MKILLSYVVNVLKISAKDIRKTFLILRLFCYWKLSTHTEYLASTLESYSE